MNIIALDFETYYDKEYSLSKITTEEYVRSELFEAIGVGVQVNDEPTVWFSGDHQRTYDWLHEFDWQNSFLLAHNAVFDASILSWRFDVYPKGILDTLSMARAWHGVDVGGSLAFLAEKYQLGKKGTEVVDALGKRRADFSPDELKAYSGYCINDVNLTRALFDILIQNFPTKELKVIDTTIKMFTEPTLELDLPLLEQHLENVKAKKEQLLEMAAANRDDLMSNDKFAELLKKMGVEPPVKISAKTGKEAWAFAKTDEAFKELANHPDPRVQILVGARLGNKTTLEETRTQRFIDIAKRGAMPVPLKYYAAHTGRWGGDDKVNLQNLPSRGQNANKLKRAIRAPEGFVIIDSDSSQIEARVLAWLAEQNDLVEAFEKGEDVYKIMASAIYGKPVEEISKDERFVGKTTILGCIGAGTLILCDSGWKPIEQVSLSDKLWDGEEWVCHQGLLNKGIKETLSLCGAWLTPDHKVWSGIQWLEAQSVVADESILSQALGIGAANLPSQAMYVAQDLALKPLSYSANAIKLNTQSTTITSRILEALGVHFVQRKPLAPSDIGHILKQWLTMPTEQGYLTGCLLPLPVATTPTPRSTRTMEVEVFMSAKNGVTIGQRFLNMQKRWMGGTTPQTKLTGLTTIKGMNQGTFGLQHEARTCSTSEKSSDFRRKLMTYDLAYAGPRNRFTVLTERGPVIVHNCGYSMGAAKFAAQLKVLGTEVAEDECKRIIDVYRSTYAKIPELWSSAQRCLEAIIQKQSASLGRADVLTFDPLEQGFMLPNKLWLRYEGLHKTLTDGKMQYEYPTRKGATKTYGGKVIENLCQAIARCVIAEQMTLIAKRYKVVLTVHDAVACIAPKEEAEEAKAYVEQCMRSRPQWCIDLPLNCEAGYGESYGDC